MDNSKIFIVPTNDKPVKLIFENQQETTVTEKHTTEKEALQYTIRLMWANKTITGQQYKSEKGKIRRKNFKEVINFLTKRNMYKFYMDDLNTVKTIFTIRYNIPIDWIKDNKFGIITI